VSKELSEHRLLVESLRDELGQVRKLEQTLHDVENEKQKLESQLSTKETSLAQVFCCLEMCDGER